MLVSGLKIMQTSTLVGLEVKWTWTCWPLPTHTVKAHFLGEHIRGPVHSTCTGVCWDTHRYMYGMLYHCFHNFPSVILFKLLLNVYEVPVLVRVCLLLHTCTFTLSQNVLFLIQRNLTISNFLQNTIFTDEIMEEMLSDMFSNFCFQDQSRRILAI